MWRSVAFHVSHYTVSRRKAALEAAFLTVLFDARKVRGSVGL